jgi:dTDP-L-rhamnose 4-epimerase
VTNKSFYFISHPSLNHPEISINAGSLSMSKRILITGGAGFIGSHLADALLKQGHFVRALDILSAQVHGPEKRRPDYLNSEVELMIGDVRDSETLRKALDGMDVVYHLAAKVGVGQSMYEVAQYTAVNHFGTATLLEQLIQKPVEKLIVASSMSIYGEGLYVTADGSIAQGKERTLDQLKERQWELRNEQNEILIPLPTPESKKPSLPSVYALSKYVQERMCLMLGKAYGIPSVALRFFNVYGSRQSLSNPYTGVLAIFASRLLNDQPPQINEDGNQQRDFVSVYDVVQACVLAMENSRAIGHVFNVGSGNHYTIRNIADRISQAIDKRNIEPQVTGKYRMGDIRHCFADISLAKQILGYEPKVNFSEGLVELAAWLQGRVALDRFAEASAELTARGLSI